MTEPLTVERLTALLHECGEVIDAANPSGDWPDEAREAFGAAWLLPRLGALPVPEGPNVTAALIIVDDYKNAPCFSDLLGETNDEVCTCPSCAIRAIGVALGASHVAAKEPPK